MKTHFVLAAVAAFAGSSVALADTVDVQFLRTGQGRSVKFDLGGQRQNVFAGQLEHRFSNGSGLGADLSGDILTYCTDLIEHTSSSTSTFQVTDPQNAPGVAMGADRADALRDLYTFAGGAQNAQSADRDFAAAFQIAVWEIVYDFDSNAGRSSMNIEGGAFEAYRTNGSTLSGVIQGHLTTFFDAIGMVGPRGDGMDLYAVINDGKQDQLVELGAVVPLPSAAGLGFAGLAGLAGGRRRR